MSDLKDNKRISNILKIVLFLLVILVEIVVFIGVKTIFYNNGPAHYLVSTSGEESFSPIANGATYEYAFTSSEDKIRAFQFRLQAGPHGEATITSGEMHFQLIDVATNQVLRSSVVDCKNVTQETFFMVDMGQLIEDVNGKDFKIIISFTNIIDDEVYMLCEQQSDGSFRPVIKMNSAGSDSLQKAMWVIYTLIILATGYSLFKALFSKEFKLEQVYLVTAICLGLAMSLFMPLMTGPDETTHSRSAYYVSNVLLGVDNGDSGLLIMRADDARFRFADVDFHRNYYVEYYDSFFDKINDDTLMQSDKPMLTNPNYLYYPMGIGITVGRLLGFGPILTFMLGRWFSLAVFITAIYYAIKKLPFGKAVVFVWACLPITLQQAMSYNYDSPILAMSILVISITLSLMYDRKELSKKQRIRDIVMLALICILLAPCKSFALLPIALFPIILVVRFIYNRRTNIKECICQKKARKVATIVGSIALVLVVLVVGVYVLKLLLATADGPGRPLMWTDAYARPVGYYIAHPVELVKIFVNTVVQNGEALIWQTFGATLGWLNQPVPHIVIMMYVLLFAFAGMRKVSEEQEISIGSRVWMLFIFCGVCIVAMLGMLIGWTPSHYNVIEGVQGRYFLPGLVLLGVSLRTRNTSRSDESDRVIATLLPIVFIFVVTLVFGYKVE
ncbi:MAG: DUF2142 domain-containing protein [Lachnospiraceae bacterium]|nr:DUF2142 domain-containing protein [Lachnospiraceae bacterium]